ncbi:hypothetical protein [Bradyrhizobium genosp. SA-3]|nr:hypothetical protein [Bradyrhizobium genosp. SA-3]
MPHDPLLTRLISQLEEQANKVWRLIGDGALAPACEALRKIDRQSKVLTS